ncbi:WXG100 family type VII secretion target [Actinoplanes sp. NPDC051513]|uniref:WXG100-like domain-containing protein n=1 Tax=Actinoplanes sp. NPDC051513 TaxID=3363908 RepID=UPI0037B44503
MTVAANPLVAPAVADSPRPWAGVWIAEDIEQIATGVKNGDWVSGTLGVAGAGLDGLALVSDPVGALLQYGIAWLIEHVKPLSEALDWLAGDPAQIAAHAQTWRNAAAALTTDADGLARAVRWDTTDWIGSAGEAYRGWASDREQSLRALSQAADTMALMTEGAGVLIGTVRLMVRDAVATVVSRLIVYAGQLIATLGAAGPLVVEQATTLCASWGAKIASWLRDLIASIRKLLTEGDWLGRLIEALKRWHSEAPSGGGGDGAGSGKKSTPPKDQDPEAEAERRHALGFDPATGRHRPREEEIAARLEEELGIELERATNGDVDWVGSDGYTYDAVGNFDSRFFDREWPNLQTRILDHVEKADRVPVYVAGFTPEQKQLVRDFVDAHQWGSKVFLLGE